VSAFVVYNANLRSFTSADTRPTRYLPISILTELDFDLDEFPFLYSARTWPAPEGELPYYLRRARGHLMSNYPVMPAILSLPVYALPVLFGLTDGTVTSGDYSQTEIVGTALAKVSASLAVALSVGLIYLALLRFASPASACWIAAIYAFATSSWSVSSQGLWQTAMSQPLFAAALYAFAIAEDRPRAVTLAGLALGLSAACRPPNVLLLLVFFVYVVFHHRPRVLAFTIPPLVIGSFVIAYNIFYFGSPIGGYVRVGAAEFFNAPSPEALAGLLVSPSRGMLYYSPVLIFAWAGLTGALVSRRDPLLEYSALATVLLLLFYSTWRWWNAAFSYSYRFLVDLLPALALFLAVIWPWVMARRWRVALLMVATVFSIGVQAIGAFCYPCGWYETPVPVSSTNDARFWDWSDPEFLRCLRAGPVESDGLRLLRDVWAKQGASG
jgi:hypothetical protein